MVKCLMVFGVIAAVGAVGSRIIPPVFEVEDTFFGAILHRGCHRWFGAVKVYHAQQAVEREIVAVAVAFDCGKNIVNIFLFIRQAGSVAGKLTEYAVKPFFFTVSAVVTEIFRRSCVEIRGQRT